MKREWATLTGNKKSFQVIDQTDQEFILRLILKKMSHTTVTASDKIALNVLQKQIGVLQTNLITTQVDYWQKLIANNWADFPTNQSQRARLWEIFQRYNEYKQVKYLVDFNDLLVLTYQTLIRHPAILIKWQQLFQHVAIDEFQDINQLQYQLITLLTDFGKKITVTIVGDPDQTIYGWRNARIGFISKFKRDFVQIKTVYLNRNYRSNSVIITAANHLISHNQQRLPKQLIAATKLPLQPLQIYDLVNRSVQAKLIVQEIQRLLISGVKPSTIVILYRSNWLALSLETELKIQQIPYAVYKRTKFFQRVEIKQLLVLLGFLATQDDFYLQMLLLRLLRLESKILHRLQAAAITARQSLMQFLQTQPWPTWLNQIKPQLIVFWNHLTNWLKIITHGSLIYTLVQQILTDYYEIQLQRLLDYERRWENVVVFLKSIQTFDQQQSALPLLKRLREFLNITYIYTDYVSTPLHEVVQLMTVHNAKGLEFDHVFMFDVSTNVFPSAKSVDQEEERRLFFVALTRARFQLILTTATDEPSPFIKELTTLSETIVKIKTGW